MTINPGSLRDPSIVCVFPAPAEPNAKIDTLKPNKEIQIILETLNERR